MNQKEIFYHQIAIDYSCSIEDVKSDNHIFTQKKYLEGRRIFWADDCLLKVICLGKKLIMSGEGEIVEWCRQNYQNASAAWFFQYKNLRALDEKLQSMGHKIGDTHHYYLPGGLEREVHIPKENGVTFELYDQQFIEQFRGRNPYPEAFSFLEDSPDVIALVAKKEGEIIGVAGASSDSEKMWQIGINVMPKGEHMGLGVALVTGLKNEILAKGILPFYGTSESHIRSQNVGIASGFVPAWAELYTVKNHIKM